MKRFLFSLVLVLSCTFILSADTIVLSRENRGTGLVITQDNVFARQAPSLTLDCHVATMEANEISTPKGTFTYIYIPGQCISHDVGAPQLPSINRIIEIPQGAEVSVQVIAASETEYNLKDLGINYAIYPRQPSLPKDGSTSEFVYNPEAYQVRGYSTRSVAAIEKIGTLRSYRLALLTVFPVAYNPTENKIKVYNDIRIEISLNGADYAQTLDVKTKYESLAFNWVKNNILTAESIKTLPVRTIGTGKNFLIVADRMFEATLEPFVAWKKSLGFTIVVEYTDKIGTTVGAIKAFTTQAFAEFGNYPADYLLLVGDLEQITATKTAHYTDLYYANVTAGDYLPDIVYGRFSAQTVEQLIPQIEKTLIYEKNAEPDKAYLGKVVLTAGWDSSHAKDWGWPQIQYAKKYFFKSENGYKDVLETLTSGSGQGVAEIKAAIDKGCAVVNYTAHGSQTSWADPSMSITDVEGYKNEKMYPLVIGNCCLTSSFQVSKCFGEAWLRTPNGAIGYIGGSNSTYWDEDLWWGNGKYTIVHPYTKDNPPTMEDTGKGFYESLFTDAPSIAAAMIAGNLAVEETASSRKLYYWEVYHLFGDPTLKLKFPSK